MDQTIQSVLASNPVSSWHVIGGLGYLVQTPPLVFESNTFTMQNLAEKANKEFCQSDWDSINKQYPDNEYLYTSCLNASYFYALIVEGYGINQQQPIHFFPSSQNGGDWTLGVVLHH